jgi:DNA-binding transcriptional LysR family regulator
MELRHIRYFLAVADEKNFTRAAARVGIGQPPLSQQIKDLEGEVGTNLFQRLPQGAELTEAGRAFLEIVKGFPAQAERAVRAAQRAARGESGTLRVGFTGSAVFNPVVAGTVRKFRRAYADVELSLVEVNSAGLVSGLVEGTLDAAFLRPGTAGVEELHLRLLSEEPMLAVLPASHTAAKDEVVHLTRLRSDPFILWPRSLGSTLFDTIIAACRKAGFEPVLGQTAPQIGSVINFVAAELGVSLVPASMQAVKVPGVVYRAVSGAAPVARLSLATRRGDTSPILRNFVARAVA